MNVRASHPAVDDPEFGELWDVLSTLPPDERGPYLDACAIDPAARSEVESLLQYCTSAESFFRRLTGPVDGLVRAAASEATAEPLHATSSDGTSDPSLHPGVRSGTTVAHYLVGELLGQGGMGVVYRAHDTQLDRTVALKFLSPALHADARARHAFLAEARAAAALDHPNICTVHEVNDDAGATSFIAMAYYAGATLEQVLRRGVLPLPQALEYALQAARGLEAAHARGIIHGDIKPANVLITSSGIAKLLDFGIARLAGEHSGTFLPGTIPYMSPEQLQSSPGDVRSDLWSFGVLLYELCTGVHPFRGDDATAVLRAIATESPPPPESLWPALPPGLGAIIQRLLEKDPAARYPNAGELLADLAAERAAFEAAAAGAPAKRARRRITAGALLALLVAGGLFLGGGNATHRVIVADAEGDTAAGRVVSERLRQGLASAELTVMGRAAAGPVLARMGKPPDVRLTPATAREVALREGMPRFVHVTVDRIGKAFTLAAVLVDAESGDLLEHQQAVALGEAELPAATDRLAAGLRRALGRSRLARLQQAPPLAVTTDSLSALRLHLAAVQANRNGDFRRGVELEDETITIDPDFADAHLTRAFALEQIGLRAGQSQQSIMRAASLRERLARHERYSVEADYYWHVEGDLQRAITSLRNSHQAIQVLQPGRVLNRRSYGWALMLRGDLADAESVLEEGRHYATCPVTNTHLVSVLHALGKNREARSVLQQALDQWPTNPLLGMDRAHFLAVRGRYRDAHRAAGRLEREYALPFALRAEAVFDAVEGRFAEAIEHLERLRDHHVRTGLLPPAVEVAIAIARLRLLEADSARARAELNGFLARHPLDAIPPAERPYLSLALFHAQAHDPGHARLLLAEYDTAVPALFKGPDRWMQHRARAALAMAEEDPARALLEWREAAGSNRIWANWLDNPLFTAAQRPELGLAHERLGQVDSAIATYERYLAAPVLYRSEMDAFHLAHVLRRLAVLHAERGEPQLAGRYETRLRNLWHDADRKLKRAWDLT